MSDARYVSIHGAGGGIFTGCVVSDEDQKTFEKEVDRLESEGISCFIYWSIFNEKWDNVLREFGPLEGNTKGIQENE